MLTEQFPKSKHVADKDTNCNEELICRSKRTTGVGCGHHNHRVDTIAVGCGHHRHRVDTTGGWLTRSTAANIL